MRGEGTDATRERNGQSTFDFADAPVDDGSIAGLLERNQAWTETLDEGYFDAVRDDQDPNAVSVCCADSRVAQSGMFAALCEAGSLFTPSNIGNKAVVEIDGETVVDGNFGYALSHLDVETAAVVGHTGCGAITAAYQVATGDLDPAAESPGIRAEVEPLVPIVEDAIADPAIETDGPQDRVIDRLVEYNVHRQVEALDATGEVPESVRLAGFVYDFVGAYGSVDGRTVLVNADGERDVGTLRESVPDSKTEFVGTLLD